MDAGINMKDFMVSATAGKLGNEILAGKYSKQISLMKNNVFHKLSWLLAFYQEKIKLILFNLNAKKFK